MKVVLQRVLHAAVEVDGAEVARIGHGLLLLCGVEEGDSEDHARWLVQKIINMRIFSDIQGKMNLSVLDLRGEILCVSQFTLLADYRKGNRPSFIKAARPAEAVPLFEYFKSEIGKSGLKTESGIFGADMKVALLNDGPVTLTLDSKIRP